MTGAGDPRVLVHGFTGNSDDWELVVDELVPGAGHSPQQEATQAWLQAVADHLATSGRPAPPRTAPLGAAQAAESSLAQYLHLVAATGMSPDRQCGHFLVGGGSPNTVFPSLFM